MSAIKPPKYPSAPQRGSAGASSFDAVKATARPAAGAKSESAKTRRPTAAARSPILSALLVIIAGAALFFISGRENYLIGQIGAPLLTLGALHGLWRGGFYKIIMLPMMLLVLVAVAHHPQLLDPILSRISPNISTFTGGMLTLLVAGVFLLVCGLVVSAVRRRFIARHRVPLAIDRLLGASIGAGEGALILLCLCWTVTLITPTAQTILDHPETVPGSFRHAVASTILRLADESSRGAVGEVVSAYNPIAETPALAEAIDKLNTQGQLDLNSLDPETVKLLDEIIQKLPDDMKEGMTGQLEAYREGNVHRDQAYRQLPAPGGS